MTVRYIAYTDRLNKAMTINGYNYPAVGQI